MVIIQFIRNLWFERKNNIHKIKSFLCIIKMTERIMCHEKIGIATRRKGFRKEERILGLYLIFSVNTRAQQFQFVESLNKISWQYSSFFCLFPPHLLLYHAQFWLRSYSLIKLQQKSQILLTQNPNVRHHTNLNMG